VTFALLRKDGFAPRTLDTPNGHATQTNPHIMGVACETAAAHTGRLVLELKADGKDKGENELNEGFAIAQQLQVGGFIVKIDGDSAVLSGPFGCAAHVLPSCHQAS
jgi:hypothetical protein